ncbi:TPA: N-acetylmuramoyl-L-alanine amidase [Listeria monocytogenes]|nr:hypothetical protein [Listeria monocytogenes]HBL8234950.1 N-acetylmuramoyl-L-alanine amidase [Listeria monocytogenes]HCA3783154.1 N-acetylmuramoyl-L-alanine amidase [Listeria monocytogenes]HCA4002644.1 N-acetylmuramoyl-L-alanine amidase [Listeria monocytogenes]HCA4077429.1 N-acetylmuramoyl-L-alanine amidase [Listeria monocytogenes]
MTKKLKLAVFAGHGGVDSGAVGNGYHEDDLALDIMKRTTKVLRNAGHTVINNRTADVNRNISADAKLANREKVAAVIEFHFDAAGASAEGTTGFYCATSSSSKRLAQCVNDKLDDVFKDRNVKPDTSTRHGRLGILRETKAVATLQEVAFITNKNDVAKYNAKADEVARKAAEGILSYFNEKLSVAKPTTPSKPAPKPATPMPNNSYKNKKLVSKVNGLRFYNKPSWSDKDVAGTVTKGIGFPTIVSKVKVGTAYQYKVKNSKGATYYITASDKYVELKDK